MTILLLLLLFLAPIPSITARKPHVINFRSPSLYPEGITYDPSAQHFIVGSHRHRTLNSVSDAGILETLISDHTLPPDATILGLTVDPLNHRLLAVVTAIPPLPPFNALAAYDLRERRQIFLSILPDEEGTAVANDVTVDFKGNAFVTNSLGNSSGNYIWKVNAQGEASIFSRSPIFTQNYVDPDAPFSNCGLNGIAYVSKGYLLVVQSNTGKMFKVDAEDGTARTVLLSKDMKLPDGIAIRKDGVVVVVSPYKLYFLKSKDNWAEGVVYDEVELDHERFPTTVVMAREDRAYVVYGSIIEGFTGKGEREWFGIEEVVSEKENQGEHVWVFVLLGLGLACFLFWRFQMTKLVKNMYKKTN